MFPGFVFQAFGDSFYLAVAAFVLVCMVFLRRNRGALLIALLVAGLFVPLAKAFYADPRPCAGLYWCEPDFGFPSGHATVMFVFVGASLGTLGFYAFLPLAILVSYSRIADGLHSFIQVAGGAATGLVIFFICRQALDALHEKNRELHWFTGGRAKETLWHKKTRKKK